MESTVIKDRIVMTVREGFVIPTCGLVDYILARVKSFGDSTCLVDELTGKSYSYKQLMDLSARLAGALRDRGLTTGNMVCIHCRAIADFWVAYFGVIYAGGIAILGMPALNIRELIQYLNEMRPAFIIAEDIYIEKVIEAKRSLDFIQEIISFQEFPEVPSLGSLIEAGSHFCSPVLIPNPEKTCAVIILSSGTTGIPKGAQLSHVNLISIAQFLGPEGRRTFLKNDVVLAVQPATHASGFCLGLAALANGTKQILLSNFDVEKTFQCIEKHKVTSIPVFPTKAIQLVESPLIEKYDVSSLRSVFLSGSRAPKRVFEKIIAVFRLKFLHHAYGLTEAFASCTIPENLEYEHCGKPYPLVEVKVVDPETGRSLDIEQPGEICVRGPQRMMGYINRPDVTQQAIDKEGWLHTGDIGHYDNEGNIYLTDRIKDIFKCMDMPVSPSEIEDILKNHPAVLECVVVGVPHAAYGEASRAYVVLKESFVGKTTDKEIYHFVAENCSHYKHLHGGLEFVKAIPVSTSGKYLRKKLREVFVLKQDCTE